MGNRWNAIIKAVLVQIVLLSVIACSNNQAIVQRQDTDPSADDTQQTDMINPITTKVSLMLDRYPNAMHAFIYTAIANGYFREKGIELDIKQPGEPNEGLTLVGLDVIDLTLASQPHVLMARADEIPVVSIAAVVRHPLNYLMIPKSSAVQSPKNLAHRKVGYPGDGVSLAILKTMMLSDESDPDQVVMVNVKRNFVQAIASHQVDAILGGNINEDRILLANRMQPVRTIEPNLYGVPEYYELVLVANEGMVEAKSELLQTIWEILARGQQDVIDNPQQAITHVMNKQNKNFPLTMKVESESLSMLLPFMSNEADAFGLQSKSVWSEVGNWLDETGLMRRSVDSDDAYVDLAN
ncbi:MAG: ABC transporter substrate-binding protein [Paenibacillaceae bacterium]